MKTIIAILLTLQLAAQDEYVRMEPKPFDWTKTACVVDFGLTMGEMIILPNTLREDWLKHYVAGQLIGMGSNVFYYKLTHKKWLSCGLSAATGILVGGLKELSDPYREGSKTIEDFAWTANGSIRGALRVTFYLDKPRKNKPIYNP